MGRILQRPEYNLPISTVELYFWIQLDFQTECVIYFLCTFPNLVGPGIGLIFNSPVPMLLLRPFRTCSGVQSTRGLCTFHQLSWFRPDIKIHTYLGPYIPCLKAWKYTHRHESRSSYKLRLKRNSGHGIYFKLFWPRIKIIFKFKETCN